MTIGIYEKLASEKVTDTTWNIGQDLSAFWQGIYFLYLNFWTTVTTLVSKYGLL